MCTDLSVIHEATGQALQGALGIPFFRDHVIQLDFDRRVTRIMPANTPPSADWGQAIDVKFGEGDLPMVIARFGSHNNELSLLDTGSNGSLDLRADVYKYLVESYAIAKRFNLYCATVTGFSQGEGGVLDEFTLAGVSHHRLIVSESDTYSRVGLGYLRRYRATFDLGKGKLYLAPAR